jgi:hypothetical protein
MRILLKKSCFYPLTENSQIVAPRKSGRISLRAGNVEREWQK